MTPNVFIKHRRWGKLVEERAVHNSWAERGREYLRNIVTESMIYAAVENRRLKYMSLGMGGVYRSHLATVSPLIGSHSPGDQPGNSLEPRGTAGNTYRSDNLTGSGDGIIPHVSTLELPARVSGGTLDYDASATAGTDVWYIQDPNLYITMLGKEGLAVHASVDCTTGDYIYPVGPTPDFPQVPISEAGLHLDDVTEGQPYEPLVAYASFGTILLDAGSHLEVVWQVRFAP